MTSLFEKYDSNIGTDGYYKLIRNALFPLSNPETIDISSYRAEERIFKKGAVFSRVRKISTTDLSRLVENRVTIRDFLPPSPHKYQIPEGRFNDKGERILYLSDHPYVAMKECDIKEGDHFLLSAFQLEVDMCLIFVPPNKDKFSSLIHELLQTRDTRFYPLINKIHKEILQFKKHHGIAYDSVKVLPGHTEKEWGNINSTMNLALTGRNFKQTRLAVSFLATCDRDYKLSFHTMFKPLSSKKKDRISKLHYQCNRSLFAKEFGEMSEQISQSKSRVKILLEQGHYKDFLEPATKVLEKLD